MSATPPSDATAAHGGASAVDRSVVVVPQRLRCAAFHESTGADPGGTAGHHDAVLCVEVGLPWGRDISEHEPFSTLGTGPGPDGRTWRPQGLVPAGDTGGRTRVLAFEQPADARGGAVAAPYERREWWVEPEAVVDLCRSLVDCDAGGVARFDARRVAVPEDVVDLLVCTHGRRDACCGSGGTALAESLDPTTDGARVWRTSHTGGHRFAPTAWSFPDGLAWAHLDEPAAEAVLAGDVAAAAARCRGASSLAPGPAQVADRVGLQRHGARWAMARRVTEVVSFDRRTLTTTVRVTADLLDPADPAAPAVAATAAADTAETTGARGAGGHPPGSSARPFGYEVTVVVERHVPQPSCGAVDGPEYTTSPVWAVDRAVALGPGQ